MMALLLAMIAVMPFEKNPYLKLSSSFLGIPEFTVIKALGLLGLGWAAIQFLQHGVPRHATLAPQIKAFFIFVAAALLVSVQTGFAGIAASRLLGLAVLLPIVLAAVKTERHVRLVLGMSVVTLVLAFPYAYRQMLRFGGRLGVGLNEPNYTALALLLVLPVAFVFLRHARTATAWMASAGAVVVLFTQLVLTASRGGFLGLLAACTLMVLRLTRRRVLALSVVGGVLALVILVAPTSLGHRVLASIDPQVQSTAATQSTKLRLEILDSGLSLVADNPLTGVGLGNFKWAVALHTGGDVSKIAHNTYLELAAELGLPTALLFLTVIFLTFRSLRRSEKLAEGVGNTRLRDLAIAVQIGLAGYLVAAVFLSAQYEKFFWLFVFLSVPVEALAREARAKRSA